MLRTYCRGGMPKLCSWSLRFWGITMDWHWECWIGIVLCYSWSTNAHCHLACSAAAAIYLARWRGSSISVLRLASIYYIVFRNCHTVVKRLRIRWSGDIRSSSISNQSASNDARHCIEPGTCIIWSRSIFMTWSGFSLFSFTNFTWSSVHGCAPNLL